MEIAGISKKMRLCKKTRTCPKNEEKKENVSCHDRWLVDKCVEDKTNQRRIAGRVQMFIIVAQMNNFSLHSVSDYIIPTFDLWAGEL
jgi:hypothetical protein